jgi:hypothetical protein
MDVQVATVDTASGQDRVLAVAARRDTRSAAGVLTLCHPIVLGLSLMLAQLALALTLAGTPKLKHAYHRLLQWDSNWYHHILAKGYRTTVPPPAVHDPEKSNVGFLPGYPLWARIVQKVSHAHREKAMLIAAQLACWGFWVYLILLLRGWQAADGLILLALAAVAVHPAAFFLIAGYSESLFLMTLLGMIYWSQGRPRPGSALLSGAHGFMMTLTRIVGLPCAVYAVVNFLSSPSESVRTHRFWKGFALAAGASLLALAGIGSYFAYCHYRWGQWNVYLQAQSIGWQIVPDYKAVFRWKTYVSSYTHDWEETINPGRLGRLFLGLTVAGFALLAVLEAWAAWGGSRSWRGRLGLYAVAWFLFYIPASGQAGVLQFTGMSRYSFCCHVVMVLILVHLLASAPKLRQRLLPWVPHLTLIGLPLGLVSFGVQVMFVCRFLRGKWVA